MTTSEFKQNATLVQALRDMLNTEVWKLAAEALQNESPVNMSVANGSEVAALTDYGVTKGYAMYPKDLRGLAYPTSIVPDLEEDRYTTKPD